MTSMKFFFDNNLSPRLVRGLRKFGEEVIHLQEEYGQDNVLDEVWLKDIGRKGYLLITRDLKIPLHQAEKQAFKDNKVGAFFLGGKNRSAFAIIQQVIKNWPRIKELAESNQKKRPFAFRVPPAGSKIKAIPL